MYVWSKDAQARAEREVQERGGSITPRPQTTPVQVRNSPDHES